LIILEEAAFIQEGVFYEVVAPLLGVNNTTVLGISTPNGEGSYYSALLELNGPGDLPLFRVIKVGLACAACQEANAAASCTHMAHRLPVWKSAARMTKMACIMANKPDLFARENQGLVTNDAGCVFDSRLVRDMFAPEQRVVLDTNSPIDMVFMAIDPAGGGAASNYAVVSHVCLNDTRVIVGLDSSSTTDETVIHAMVADHVLRLRKIPCMRKSLLVVFVEANMSFLTAGSLRTTLENAPFAPVYVVSSNKKIVPPDRRPRAGVWTGAPEKALYVTTIQHALGADKLKIADVVTGYSAQSDLATLKDQMCSYKREVREAETPHAMAKVTYSGKGCGKQDDLAMALQIGVYWEATTLARDEQFRDHARVRHSIAI
jgi:hypothetical protein